MQSCHLCRFTAQRQRQRFGHGFTRQIVFGRSQPADRDHDVRAAQCGPKGVHEILAPVADNRLKGHGDAQFVQLFRDVEGVRVLPERRQHLRSDSNDFRFHKNSGLLLARIS